MILDHLRIPVPTLAGVVRRKVTDKTSHKEHVDVTFAVGSRISASGNMIRTLKTIGRLCEDDPKLMHPSDQYRIIFPKEWEKLTGEKAPALERDAGFYVGVNALCERTKLRSIMEQAFGKEKTKALLDYAMFSILHESNVAENLVSAMEDEVLFSDEPRSDSYYSNLFENRISRDDILTFKKNWALQCKKDGVEEVWVCIDGSNDDCTSKGVELAEHGHAKSKKNIDIVSFSYAVTTEGKPVTFEVYRGGLVDAKAMKAIIEFLKECQIQVRGVILDRGYCDSTALTYLHENGISYIVMIKGNPSGYAEVVLEYGEQIKKNTEFWVEGTHLFAAQKEIQLYDTLDWKDYVTIFYDFVNGDQRIEALFANVNNEVARLKAALAKGNKAEPKAAVKGIVSVDKERMIVEVDKIKLQEVMNEKGLYGLICSESMKPEELHSLYSSRTESEIQYRITKTSLGYGTLKIHLTKGVRSKFCAAFIASIIRQEIRTASTAIGLTTKQGIRELDLIDIRNISGKWFHDEAEVKREYTLISNLCGGQTDGKAYVQDAVSDLNNRGKVKGFRRRKTGPKKTKPEPSAEITAEIPKKKPGPKPGFKRGELNKDGSKRNKPGPKPGSKKGTFNKDGSVRQKPGPKPKEQSAI